MNSASGFGASGTAGQRREIGLHTRDSAPHRSWDFAAGKAHGNSAAGCYAGSSGSSWCGPPPLGLRHCRTANSNSLKQHIANKRKNSGFYKVLQAYRIKSAPCNEFMLGKVHRLIMYLYGSVQILHSCKLRVSLESIQVHQVCYRNIVQSLRDEGQEGRNSKGDSILYGTVRMSARAIYKKLL